MAAAGQAAALNGNRAKRYPGKMVSGKKQSAHLTMSALWI